MLCSSSVDEGAKSFETSCRALSSSARFKNPSQLYRMSAYAQTCCTYCAKCAASNKVCSHGKLRDPSMRIHGNKPCVRTCLGQRASSSRLSLPRTAAAPALGPRFVSSRARLTQTRRVCAAAVSGSASTTRMSTPSRAAHARDPKPDARVSAQAPESPALQGNSATSRVAGLPEVRLYASGSLVQTPRARVGHAASSERDSTTNPAPVSRRAARWVTRVSAKAEAIQVKVRVSAPAARSNLR
jgi:hypothetical protein